MSVRTVTGDVPSNDLGRVLVHEHLILDNALIAAEMPHIHLPSVEDAVTEITPCVASGITGMVDAMPAAGGRHAERLAAISDQTGIAIIATTGLHTEKYYVHHPWALHAEPEELVPLFVADIEVGIDRFDYSGPLIERTSVRAGIIKVATDGRGMTDRARRLFTAAAEVAAVTGVPILTHTEDGLGAMEQIGFLADVGVPLDRVVISHTDKVADLGYHEGMLETGVNLEYDQALRQPAGEPNRTAVLIGQMVERGHAAQLMVGTDGARRSLWSSLGGSPGIPFMGTGFVDALRGQGVTDLDIDRIYAANPQRFLDRTVAA